MQGTSRQRSMPQAHLQFKRQCRAAMRRTLALALCAAAPIAAASNDYPKQNISLIVPFAAGGPTDALSRLIAQSMSKTLGKQIIVENVPGAGGIIGRAKVARSGADGYTLMFAGSGTATSATLYRKLSYDPVNAFDAIAMIAETPMVLVARKNFPVRDIAKLIEYIKANGDRITYANGGLGSGSHLCGLLLMQALQTKMTTVQYRGSGPAMLDVMAGRIDLLCDQTTTALAPLHDGSIKGYAVTRQAGVPSLPNLPTLHDAGLKGFDLSNWSGLMAPQGTPGPILERLAAAVHAAINDPATVKRMEEFGALPVRDDRSTPGGFRKFFLTDVAKWAAIIKAEGTYAD